MKTHYRKQNIGFTTTLFPILFLCLLLACPDVHAVPRTPDDEIEISCGEENPGGQKVLIAYDTIHGSTAEVAENIGTSLCAEGYLVDVRFVGNVDSLDAYDAVIIGSAIYRFTWLADALAFMETNRETLASMPTAFFIVGAALFEDTPESRAAVRQAFVDPVLEEHAAIDPLAVGLFGGAVDFTTNSYTFFEAFVLRVLGLFLGFTDSADWRDWNSIQDWSEEVGALLR